MVEMYNVWATNELELSWRSGTKNESRPLPLFKNIGEFAVVLETPSELRCSLVRGR
jgi:hypothetical protein